VSKIELTPIPIRSVTEASKDQPAEKAGEFRQQTGSVLACASAPDTPRQFPDYEEGESGVRLSSPDDPAAGEEAREAIAQQCMENIADAPERLRKAVSAGLIQARAACSHEDNSPLIDYVKMVERARFFHENSWERTDYRDEKWACLIEESGKFLSLPAARGNLKLIEESSDEFLPDRHRTPLELTATLFSAIGQDSASSEDFEELTARQANVIYSIAQFQKDYPIGYQTLEKCIRQGDIPAEGVNHQMKTQDWHDIFIDLCHEARNIAKTPGLNSKDKVREQNDVLRIARALGHLAYSKQAIASNFAARLARLDIHLPLDFVARMTFKKHVFSGGAQPTMISSRDIRKADELLEKDYGYAERKKGIRLLDHRCVPARDLVESILRRQY
jgi:hypothetical protein